MSVFMHTRTSVARVSSRRLPALSAAIALVIAATAGAADTPKPAARGPIAQYWMDLATYNMMGMDEMPGGIAGSMMGGMIGTRAAQGRDGRHAKGVGNFGMTKYGGMPGRQIDIALYTANKPAGTSATQETPQRADVGAEPLHLLTPPREGTSGSGEETTYPERPRGRILFYWGCSASVKPGQPRVIDMAKFSAQDYAGFMQGRSVPDRGARAEPGYAIWPNDRENSRVARSASVAGEHVVTGEGVPDNLKFTLSRDQDFMPSFRIESGGKLADSIRVHWQSIEQARAYLLTAMSVSEDKSGAPDLVLWSSSELPDPGTGLMNYASNANVDKWLREKVLLAPTQTECEVPAGIFAKAENAMLQGIAYGNEANFSYPPKPANAPATWSPDWVARVRNKSVAMNMLGENAASMNGRGRDEDSGRDGDGEGRGKQEKKGPVDALKGLFGH
ncbi:hypothetical protein [Rudaea cellulosilytica]|uniref:hypothetical protein n=1 Tax=Rudaea cellulosilytica TaxID=540746 RepID=UPI00039E1178|nr:hypothetical protein [Rudaea cellulosilytica]